MSKFRIGWLAAICLLTVALFSVNALAAGKVVVVSGVTEEGAKKIGTYLMVYEGINEVLGEKGIKPDYLYVGLDEAPDDAAKKEAGDKMVAEINTLKPDLVIVLNDACLKYVGAQIKDIPVVFTYIFSRDYKSLGLPQSNITGVTRRSYAPDIWGLAHKLTGGKTVALLSKNSVSMQGVRKYLFAGADKLEKASGVRYKEMYLCDTFEQWKGHVDNWKEDLIYLADTSRIAKDGKDMTRTEIVKWTVDNAKVPVVAATGKDTEAGALFSIITSENQIGRQAAEMATKILGGTAPADLPYSASSKGKLVVNGTTSTKLKIEIPYEILSTADKIYE